MNRIIFACIDIAASVIFIIPILVICNKFVFENFKHTILYIIFAFYLIAVMSLVGTPSVNYIQIDFSINFIPFVDMISDASNALLNVLLFIPMGFLLPILWEECRETKKTILICLCISSVIEILQIFTFRTTDINDLITNTFGGIIGFIVAKVITKGFSKYIYSNTKYYEKYIVFVVSFAVMFFAVPFVSEFMLGFSL